MFQLPKKSTMDDVYVKVLFSRCVETRTLYLSQLAIMYALACVRVRLIDLPVSINLYAVRGFDEIGSPVTSSRGAARVRCRHGSATPSRASIHRSSGVWLLPLFFPTRRSRLLTTYKVLTCLTLHRVVTLSNMLEMRMTLTGFKRISTNDAQIK